MKHIILKIPVEPQVKAYLDTIFKGKPAELVKNHHITRFLWRLLKNPLNRSKYKPFLSDKYSELFEVKISHYYFFNAGCHKLPTETIIEFNNYVHDIFTEKFNFAMLLREADLKNRKDAIRFVIHHHKMEDEDTGDLYERLKKSFYRFRKDSNQEKMEKTLKFLRKPVGSMSPKSA